jgi:RNA polymerase sigma-70 factor (TIGR02960 family)
MTAITEATFENHRRELHVHCYRMLANYQEAEDAVQDTFTRAWQARERVGDDSNARAWLYKIATNVCLDRMRQVKSFDRSFSEVPWLTPYPDRLLDELMVARETIELAFLAMIQLLPARQRAVLLLREVLDYSAAETAEVLEMSVPAVNSALQRARATIAQRPPREQPVERVSPYEQELLERFIDAHQRMDAAASIAAVREDIRITMPPNPMYFEGREAMRGLFARAEEMGEWRLVPAWANRMPCAASYLRAPGDTVFRAWKFDVLRVEGDEITETTTFAPDLIELFGLPRTLDA